MIRNRAMHETLPGTKSSTSSRHAAAASSAGRYAHNSPRDHWASRTSSANSMARSSHEVTSTDLCTVRKRADKIDARLSRSSHRIYMVAASATHTLNSELGMALRKIIRLKRRQMLSASKSLKRAASTYESRKSRRIEEPPNSSSHRSHTDKRSRRNLSQASRSYLPMNNMS